VKGFGGQCVDPLSRKTENKRVANFSVGNVPTELTRNSMTLCTREVMPKLKHINSDAPVTAGAMA